MWDIRIVLRVISKMNSVELKAEFYRKLPSVLVYIHLDIPSPLLY